MEDNAVNSFIFQYLINYNFSDGFYIFTAPQINVLWQEKASEAWVIPFGLGVGKVFKLNKRFINTSISGYYNTVKTESDSFWSIQAMVQFLFPK